jgi:hypothetical protein
MYHSAGLRQMAVRSYCFYIIFIITHIILHFVCVHVFILYWCSICNWPLDC